MAHTNSTPNYALPQFLSTDKPAWLTDVNPAYTAIDTGMHNAQTAADAAQNDATQALSDAATADGKATTADAKGSGAIASLAATFDSTATYNVGDYVIYNNLLYICDVAVTTPGPWTGSTNWSRTTMSDILANFSVSSLNDIDDVDLTGVDEGDLMQWANVDGVMKYIPLTTAGLRNMLILSNFAVYSADRILANSNGTIPLTQNLFVLFFKAYSRADCFGAYLVSYHPSVQSTNYITPLVIGNAYQPTLSIVDGNKLRIATGGVDVYYSMLRLN